jgi:uncharacterized protein YjiS (DUF1127 family)
MWIVAVFKTIRAYRAFNRNMRELSSLDERTLRDIGISRGELLGRAWNRAWR